MSGLQGSTAQEQAQHPTTAETPLKDMVAKLRARRGTLVEQIAAIDRELEEAGISTKPKRDRKKRSDAGQPKAKP